MAKGQGDGGSSQPGKLRVGENPTPGEDRSQNLHAARDLGNHTAQAPRLTDRKIRLREGK